MSTDTASTAIPLKALELLGRWNRFVKGYEMGQAGSVVRLLQAFAKRSIEASEAAQRTMLDDIQTALDTAEGVDAAETAAP